MPIDVAASDPSVPSHELADEIVSRWEAGERLSALEVQYLIGAMRLRELEVAAMKREVRRLRQRVGVFRAALGPGTKPLVRIHACARIEAERAAEEAIPDPAPSGNALRDSLRRHHARMQREELAKKVTTVGAREVRRRLAPALARIAARRATPMTRRAGHPSRPKAFRRGVRRCARSPGRSTGEDPEPAPLTRAQRVRP